MRIGFALSPKCVKTSHLDDGAVTSAKIGSGAVTEAKIASNAVTEAKIYNGAVTSNKIGSGAVTETKIASNAVTETKIAEGAVSLLKLKTSYGTVGTTEEGNFVLPGGAYGFYPQFRVTGLSTGSARLGYRFTNSAWVTVIYLQAFQGDTTYAQQRYVTSSGEVFWIYILRDIATKKIIAIWQCPDHPCFGNGGDPTKVPHPFLSFIPNEQEIIVCNPSINEVKHMRSIRGDRDLTDVIRDDYIVDERSNPVWTEKEITVGLPDDHDWSMGEITPLKRRIPKPDMIIHKSLIRKNV